MKGSLRLPIKVRWHNWSKNWDTWCLSS